MITHLDQRRLYIIYNLMFINHMCHNEHSFG